MQPFDYNKYLKNNPLLEGEQANQELFRLKQSFMPDFEEFVELNLIEKIEDNDNVGYSKQEIDFARQLKQVLEILKQGEI